MQRYLVEPLLEARIPKAVELIYFRDVVMLSCGSDVEVNLGVFFVVLVDDRAY